MGRTLVALYRDTTTAHEVVASLLEAGFSIEDVSLLVKDDGAYSPHTASNSEFAALGALVGALVGMGMALVPDVGPVMGMNTLGILMTAGLGAAAGALTGGISAELIDVDADAEAGSYQPTLQQAGTIVHLTTNDQWLEWADRIMRRYEPLKIEEREANWYGSSLGKFDLEHASSRAMQVIRDRSSSTIDQIKSGTALQRPSRRYEYPN